MAREIKKVETEKDSIYDSRPAKPVKRIAAWIVDMILMLVVATGIAWLVSLCYGYDNYNLEDIKKEYPDTVEEVSSSDVEEKVDNLPEAIYQKLKPDNTKAIIMISVGFVVLIIGFVRLRRGKKREYQKRNIKFQTKNKMTHSPP